MNCMAWLGSVCRFFWALCAAAEALFRRIKSQAQKRGETWKLICSFHSFAPSAYLSMTLGEVYLGGVWMRGTKL
uniref:Uncharacterized protein n=1 Tax=Setaria viridis TaxID=4556 RepID=A0A4V6D455_SETVI|nr:hypothetical protein SEVIR_7G137550v2 [Setaria viridis]